MELGKRRVIVAISTWCHFETAVEVWYKVCVMMEPQ
jgi:hypothetical protein